MKAATIIFSPNGGISLIESFALVCMFAHTNLITYESLYSSSYLLNEYLLYDKLWGPSQRVVTLLNFRGDTNENFDRPVISILLRVFDRWCYISCIDSQISSTGNASLRIFLAGQAVVCAKMES